MPDDKTERVDGAESVISVNPNLKFPLCEANHWLSRCHLFKGKSYEERYKFVREKVLCDKCLQSGHLANTCPKQSFCQVSNCNGQDVLTSLFAFSLLLSSQLMLCLLLSVCEFFCFLFFVVVVFFLLSLFTCI